LKKFVIGFMLGAVFFSSVSYAATSTEVKAYITDFKLKIHGKETPLTNKIVSINGSSYLPVKEISNLLGYQVAWDDKNKTVKIGTEATINSDVPSLSVKVSIPDKALEAIVRRTINKPTGDIYTGDGKNLTGIFDNGEGVKSLEGLQYFSNLKSIQLSQTSVTDLKPLEKMTQLEMLDLYKSNISDISILNGLKNLKSLNLMDNNITDITALSGLVNLETLLLDNNQIRDLKPIKNLKNLQTLSFSNNLITDITPLKELNISNKYRTVNGLLQSNSNLYYQLPTRQTAFRLNSKLYLLEFTSSLGLYVDVNNKLYTNSHELGSIASFISIAYGKYSDSRFMNNNPFVDGVIQPDQSQNFIDYEQKYLNATETYTEGKIYNIDKSKSYPYRMKKNDYLGLIEVNEYQQLIPFSDVMKTLEIKFNVDFDLENKLTIFSFD